MILWRTIIILLRTIGILLRTITLLLRTCGSGLATNQVSVELEHWSVLGSGWGEEEVGQMFLRISLLYFAKYHFQKLQNAVCKMLWALFGEKKMWDWCSQGLFHFLKVKARLNRNWGVASLAIFSFSFFLESESVTISHLAKQFLMNLETLSVK